MKVRLNITIDETVLQKAKKYAARNDASISALIEDYLDKIAGNDEVPLHILAMGSLKNAGDKVNAAGSNEYLESRRSKYGF